MAGYQAAGRARGDTTGLHHDLTEAVRGQVGHCWQPVSAPPRPRAGPVITTLMARYAPVFGRPDDAAPRAGVGR